MNSVCQEAQTRVMRGDVDEDEDSDRCPVGGQIAPGMPERHARHHREDHDGGRACRQRVDRRSDRNADVEDRKSEKPVPTTTQP